MQKSKGHSFGSAMERRTKRWPENNDPEGCAKLSWLLFLPTQMNAVVLRLTPLCDDIVPILSPTLSKTWLLTFLPPEFSHFCESVLSFQATWCVLQ